MGRDGNSGHLITESVETREALHFINIIFKFSIYIFHNEKHAYKLK
jgi:hypothetical protein